MGLRPGVYGSLSQFLTILAYSLWKAGCPIWKTWSYSNNPPSQLPTPLSTIPNTGERKRWFCEVQVTDKGGCVIARIRNSKENHFLTIKQFLATVQDGKLKIEEKSIRRQNYANPKLKKGSEVFFDCRSGRQIRMTEFNHPIHSSHANYCWNLRPVKAVAKLLTLSDQSIECNPKGLGSTFVVRQTIFMLRNFLLSSSQYHIGKWGHNIDASGRWSIPRTWNIV